MTDPETAQLSVAIGLSVVLAKVLYKLVDSKILGSSGGGSDKDMAVAMATVQATLTSLSDSMRELSASIEKQTTKLQQDLENLNERVRHVELSITRFESLNAAATKDKSR